MIRIDSRKTVTVILFILCPLVGYGQTFTVESESGPNRGVVYLGLPNNIHISVEKYRNEDVVLTTDNGKIEKQEEYHFFRLSPDSLGSGTLTVKVKTSKGIKELGKWRFRVSSIPLPVAQVAGKSNGEIRKEIFEVQLGLVIVQLCCGFDFRSIVQSFSVIVLRNDEIVFARNKIGPLFKGSIRQFFKNDLQAGDVVVFCNIVAMYPGLPKLETPLAPIQIKIN